MNVGVHFHTVIISFCPNLTMSNGSSIPVAAFTVGDTKGAMAAALVMPLDSDALADVATNPFVAELLATLPDSLHLRIMEMLDVKSPGSTAEVVDHLVQIFQNTIHISRVYRGQFSALTTTPETVSDDLQALLLTEARQAYTRDVRSRLKARIVHEPRPAHRSWPLEAPEHRVEQHA